MCIKLLLLDFWYYFAPFLFKKESQEWILSQLRVLFQRLVTQSAILFTSHPQHILRLFLGDFLQSPLNRVLEANMSPKMCNFD